MFSTIWAELKNPRRTEQSWKIAIRGTDLVVEIRGKLFKWCDCTFSYEFKFGHSAEEETQSPAFREKQNVNQSDVNDFFYQTDVNQSHFVSEIFSSIATSLQRGS